MVASLNALMQWKTKNSMKIIAFFLLLVSSIYAKSDYDHLFMRESVRFNIPFKLLKAIALTESNLNHTALIGQILMELLILD